MDFTEEHLKGLVDAMATGSITKGSFSRCRERFRGERDPAVVERFIIAIHVYKDIERIDDADAIREFPLLLEDSAATWWQVVQSEATKWEDVITLLRSAYAPVKPDHRIFLDIFEQKQKPNESTDDFICTKRAMFSQLAESVPTESIMIDMIYGLLNIQIRDRVPRNEVKTFEELLTKARDVELLMFEKAPQRVSVKTRCNFCKCDGHTINECRKKEKQDPAESHSYPVEPKIHCCKCKAPGFAWSNCPNCKELPKGSFALKRKQTSEENYHSPNTIQDIFQNDKEIPSKRSQLREDEAVGLSSVDRDRLNHLLAEQQSVFYAFDEPTPFGLHRINTADHHPVATTPLYRLSPIRGAQLKTELEKMLAKDIIEECDSLWAAPVVLIPKKDGGIRVCIDYRELNSITVPEPYPLPNIDDHLHSAKQIKFISTLDLGSGFYQIQIADEDMDKTAFITPLGMFRFKRMPFGLRNAFATFHEIIGKLRKRLTSMLHLAYEDDLIICSNSFDEHLFDLKYVLERLLIFKLKVNRKTSNFCCSEVRYFGHVITDQGVKVDPDTTVAISSRSEPKNTEQVLSFLETCSYYSHFIEHFADVSKPLNNLTKENSLWKWGQEEQTAFDTLKTLLITPPILQQARDGLPFRLRTAASNYAIGAVLVQGEKADEHPIEYASRLLSVVERNFSTTEREALAIAWAVNKFRGYLKGREVILVTNHQPLKWLMNLQSPTGRLPRWALQLQLYNFKIDYTLEGANAVAVMLSRPSCNSEQHEENNCGICNFIPSTRPKEVRDVQLQDRRLSEMIESFESNDANMPRWSSRGYTLNDGILCKYSAEYNTEYAQLVVPPRERQAVLKNYHNAATAAHNGLHQTFSKIASNFFWAGMRNDVFKYIANCLECQRYKRSNTKPTGQTVASMQRFEVLSVDLFGPLTATDDGFRWILIAEDLASGWIEIFPLKEATAQSCAITLKNEVFLRYGAPRRLLVDDSRQFISTVMQQLARSLGIQQTFTSVYNTEANSIKRNNTALKTQLAVLVGNNPTSWADYLPSIRFEINTINWQGTGNSASYLTFGQELITLDKVQHNRIEEVHLSNHTETDAALGDYEMEICDEIDARPQ